MHAGRRVTILPVAGQRCCLPLPTPGLGAESCCGLGKPLLRSREPVLHPPGSIPVRLSRACTGPGEPEAAGAPSCVFAGRAAASCRAGQGSR